MSLMKIVGMCMPKHQQSWVLKHLLGGERMLVSNIYAVNTLRKVIPSLALYTNKQYTYIVLLIIILLHFTSTI